MWTSGGVSTSNAVQVGSQQWRMARTQFSHRDTLISGPVTRPAAVRMLHVDKYSVDTRVWIILLNLVAAMACCSSSRSSSSSSSSSSRGCSSCLCVGLQCVAQCTLDGFWYRAEILDVRQNSDFMETSLIFVDYGFSDYTTDASK